MISYGQLRRMAVGGTVQFQVAEEAPRPRERWRFWMRVELRTGDLYMFQRVTPGGGIVRSVPVAGFWSAR